MDSVSPSELVAALRVAKRKTCFAIPEISARRLQAGDAAALAHQREFRRCSSAVQLPRDQSACTRSVSMKIVDGVALINIAAENAEKET